MLVFTFPVAGSFQFHCSIIPTTRLPAAFCHSMTSTQTNAEYDETSSRTRGFCIFMFYIYIINRKFAHLRLRTINEYIWVYAVCERIL
jgi:hypothetical protein